jgi:hypothetical protein
MHTAEQSELVTIMFIGTCAAAITLCHHQLLTLPCLDLPLQMAIGADLSLCLQQGTSRPPVTATSRAGIYGRPAWQFVTAVGASHKNRGISAPLEIQWRGFPGLP